MLLDAEVRFYASDKAEALLPPLTHDPLEHATELKFFAHWSSHVFADIGQNALGDTFAARLEQSHSWPGEELEGRLDTGIALDGGATLPSVQYITERNDKPKRRFQAVLLGADGEPGGDFFRLERQRDWKLKLRGMHFSGKQGPLDFCGSIFVLLHALLLRRRYDTDFIEKLLRTACFVPFAYSIGQLQLPSAWTEWAAYAGEYGWSGRVPLSHLAGLPVTAYRVKTLSDEMWRDAQVASGRRFLGELPESALPFCQGVG